MSNDKVQKQFNTLINGVKAVVENTDTSQVLAIVDTFVQNEVRSEDIRKEIDTISIDEQAMSRVAERFVAALCYNLHNDNEAGAAQIDKAESQFAAAYNAYAGDIAKNGEASEQSERRVVGRMEWFARMKCQQKYRDALLPFAEAAYKELTGHDYQHQSRTQRTAAALETPNTVVSMLAQA